MSLRASSGTAAENQSAWNLNLAGSGSRATQIYDVASGDFLKTGRLPTEVCLVWLDAETLARADAKDLAIWNTSSGTVRRWGDLRLRIKAILPQKRMAISLLGRRIGHWRIDDGTLVRSMIHLPHDKQAVIAPDGRCEAAPDTLEYAAYVVQTDAGHETLTPAEFVARYPQARAWQEALGDSNTGPPASELEAQSAADHTPSRCQRP